MNRALTPISGFARWWWGELAGLLPRRLPVVELAQAAECDARVREVALRLPAAQALQRTLTLPLAAERNLGAVLAFEMDRHTPFKADAVYYGYAPLRRDPAARTLQVSLTVVPRAEIDPVLDALRARGIDVRYLEAGAARLDPGRSTRRARAGAWQAWALAGLATVLLAFALALPVARKLQEIARLERQLDKVRAEAQLAERARQDLARLAAEERALLERRQQRPAALELVQELTRLLPDSTWLNHLQIAGERVRIRGESANAAELVGALQRSATFHDVSFDGSVTRDPRTERERFALSAGTRPAVKK